MNQFQINVQVTIGVSPELNSILAVLTRIQATAPAVEAVASKKEKAPRPVEAATVKDPAPVEAATVKDPAPAADEKSEYTEVDVRAAMHALRKRIEGEDYKENPDSEGYKKWHRVLTGWFKNTAAICGAGIPSAIPDSDNRQRFIKCCEEVYVNDAGELDSGCPF